MNNQTSREIKFRAWNKQTSQMIDLKAITPFALDSSLKMDGLFIPFFDGYIVQQFTGLIDKNGREIYEGDIVQFHKGQPHKAEYEVYWKKCGFSLIDAKRDGDKYGVFTKNLDNLCPADSMTIIGNIFENPELLKGNII